jgi:hypothetical protein
MLNKGIGLSLVALVAILVLCPGTASAGPVTGTLQINSGLSGSVTVTSTTITWLPSQTPGGLIAIGGSSTGTFAADGGLNGVMLNLSSTNTPASTDLTQAAYTAYSVDFMTMPGVTLGGANVIFDLTYIDGAGTDLGASLCPTLTAVPNLNSCTLTATSPFLLTQLSGAQTLVSMQVFATAYPWNGTAITGAGTQYVGTYSTQIPYSISPLSPGPSLESILGAGGSLNGTWSATFTQTPEPGTLQLGLGAALLLAGGLARRRRSQK